MAITQQHMDTLSRTCFLPLILAMDAWVFQYLASVYFARRREVRVTMLLVASFLVFAMQLYLPDDVNLLVSLNDISETSLQLTFIIQITLIGRAVSVKVKVRSIVWFTYVAEGFIVVNWLNVLVCILCAARVVRSEDFYIFGNILESVSLVFVLIFRFYYLSMSMGIRALLAQRKAEFIVYLMLVIHEFPFAMVEDATGVSWEFPQAICHRVLMISCITLNIRQKTRKATHTNYTVASKKESGTSSRAVASGISSLAVKTVTDRPHPTLLAAAKVAITSQRMAESMSSLRDP